MSKALGVLHDIADHAGDPSTTVTIVEGVGLNCRLRQARRKTRRDPVPPLASRPLG